MSRPDAKPLPSAEFLRRCLDYDPETGLFTHRAIGVGWRDTRHAGTAAMTKGKPSGHLRGRVGGFKDLAAHRVAFKIIHGRDPIGEIDHINGDPSDNRIANLREATRTENRRNTGQQRRNWSGCTGVNRHPKGGKWYATIGHEGKTLLLGRFETKDDAIAVRKNAERQLGYSPRHGAAK